MLQNPVGKLLSGQPETLDAGVRAWQKQPVDWDMMDEARPIRLARAQTTIDREVSVQGVALFREKHPHADPLPNGSGGLVV